MERDDLTGSYPRYICRGRRPWTFLLVPEGGSYPKQIRWRWWNPVHLGMGLHDLTVAAYEWVEDRTGADGG